MEEAQSFWKKCNACKKEIAYSEKYWVCNVSTCNRKRTGLVFCEVSCWDSHLPFARHRESWAEERKAPTRAEWEKFLAGEDEPAPRKNPTTEPSQPPMTPASAKNQNIPSSPPKVILRKTPGK